jgi:hypothetical protein
VANVDTDSVVVVVYAQTDMYYVQPFVGVTTPVTCTGTFSVATHGGGRYCALLARRGWIPPAVAAELPPPGGPVLAGACAPQDLRRLEFAGRTWMVKSTGSVPFGPGPNLWSDSPDNVWVDPEGHLHLRITQRGGQWFCAEVYTLSTIGYGRYRFEVAGNVGDLAPEVVFAGFIYAEQGNEADIEFSRWGEAARPQNAQFVVQPDAVHPFSLGPGGTSTHEIHWRPEGIDFASWAGDVAGIPAPIASWSHAGSLPRPDAERLRFNLWLFGGRPPSVGDETEVVVRSLAADQPTDAVGPGGDLQLLAPRLAGRSLDYVVQLPHPGGVRLRLFDPRGRLVHELLGAHLPAGRHVGSWDPGSAGLRLARGFYFLRLDAGGVRRSARVLLLP